MTSSISYLLIAIYLPFSSTYPQVQTQLHPDKSSCQAAQKTYMTSQAVGSKWTICAKLKLSTELKRDTKS